MVDKKKRQEKKGQMKIQQMTIMILAVFFFFILAGLFILNITMRGIHNEAKDLNSEEAISFLEVLTGMGELSCEQGKTLCLDEDKIRILSGNTGKTYENFWPVASIKIYHVFPKPDREIRCPATNCNYYELHNNQQENTKEYATFVNLCKKERINGYVHENCIIAKLVAGMNIPE